MKEYGLKCNKCGEYIKNIAPEIQEEALCIDKKWGYFSEKDGERHIFCLCEKCYDEMIRGFRIPIIIKE